MRAVRILAAALCAFSFAGIGQAAASSQALPQAAARATERSTDYAFSFKDADLEKVAEAVLGQTLGLTYAVDPALTTKVSFHLEKRLTPLELLEAFESSLEPYDIVMVRKGDTIDLEPRAKAKSFAPPHSYSEGSKALGYQSVTLPLEYAAPSQVAKTLEALSPTNPVLYADDAAGLLVLGGTQSEVDAAAKVVHMIDHSGFGESQVRLFPLDLASAATVASELEKILEAAHTSGVQIVPLKRMNALFVVSRSPAAIQEVAKWVAKLDSPSIDKTTSVWVYRPKNLSADALASTLAGLTGGGTTGAPKTSSQPQTAGQGAASGGLSAAIGAPASTQEQPTSLLSSPEDPVRVSVDKEANAILLVASQAHWVQIQHVLDEIDRPPTQVLIEAAVIEVTLSNQFNLGFDWSELVSGTDVGISSINSPSGTIAAATPGFALTYASSTLKAALNALSAKTDIVVISEPKVMALDNHEAKIQVGDQVPIVTTSSQSTVTSNAPIVNSVTYQSTGIILDVTPRVSADDRVFLDISQEVSSANSTTSSDIDSPTIQERKVSTTLVLNDGGITALGGLISSNKTNTVSGAPFLSDIPVVGQLFRTNTKSSTRTEIILVITAKIVRDRPSSEAAMKKLLADMSDIKSRGLWPSP